MKRRLWQRGVIIRAGLVVSMLGIPAPGGAAQTVFTEDFSLVGADTVAWDNVGKAVALDGDALLFGMAGGAYFFRQQADGSWMQERRVQSSLFGACAFGSSVALEGGLAAVGDPNRDPSGFCTGKGSVTPYFDSGAGWSEGPALLGISLPSGPGNLYSLGSAIAISGQQMLVGAYGYTGCPIISGFPQAVFYTRQGAIWSPLQAVTGSDTAMFERFGAAVALDENGDTAVVGAYRFGTGPAPFYGGWGAAYVFRFDGSNWVEVQRLMASDAAIGDSFGRAVAIENDVIVIGAPGDAGPLSGMGSVYVFRHDGSQWVQTMNFSAPHPVVNGSFGGALALQGGQLAVGASGNQAAYVYRDVSSAFVFLQEFVSSFPGDRGAHGRSAAAATLGAGQTLSVRRPALEPRPGPSGSRAPGSRCAGAPLASLGSTVDIDGNTCIVGAPMANFVGNGSGVVLLYTIQQLALTVSTNVAGVGQTVTVTTRGGLPGTPCQLVLTLRSQPPPGLGGPQYGILEPTPDVFDSEGRHVLSMVVPAGLVGATLVFRAYGSFQPGMSGASNAASVVFL